MTGFGGASGSSRSTSPWASAKVPTPSEASALSAVLRPTENGMRLRGHGLPHQVRWNLLRMKMASALRLRIRTSSTMMAADAAWLEAPPATAM